MENKSVIITGCSSGIGMATAKLLKENGWRVFATARKTGDVEKLIHDGFEAYQLNLEDSSSIQATVNSISTKTGGKLYGLVNNASFEIISAIEDLTRDELRQQFEILFGLQELTNLVIPVFRKQGYGRIVNVGSLAGRIPLPYTGAYCASKFALEALTDALRIELCKTNIFISLIEPGPGVIQTNFNKNAIEIFCKKNTETSQHKRAYKNIENMTKIFIDKEKNNPSRIGINSDVIAKTVKKVLESKKPLPRYFVKLKWRILWLAMGVVPTIISDRMLKKYMKNIFE